jgi:hypothetical protein
MDRRSFFGQVASGILSLLGKSPSPSFPRQQSPSVYYFTHGDEVDKKRLIEMAKQYYRKGGTWIVWPRKVEG